jgi:hypothetical protein
LVGKASDIHRLGVGIAQPRKKADTLLTQIAGSVNPAAAKVG